MKLSEVLARVPPSLAEALELLDDAEAIAVGRSYLEADDVDRAGMLAFIDGGGPRFCRELRCKHEDGTPTSADLDDWLASA